MKFSNAFVSWWLLATAAPIVVDAVQQCNDPAVDNAIYVNVGGTDVDIGYISVFYDENDQLMVEATVTGDLTPSDTTDDGAPTLISRLEGEACCLEPATACTTFSKNFDSPVDVAVVSDIVEPACTDHDKTVRTTAHTSVVKNVGVEAYNDLLPQNVSVWLTTNGDNSYFSAKLDKDGSVLDDLTFDGYCIDVDTYAVMNQWWAATAYGYFELLGNMPASGEHPDIPRTGQPQNLVKAAYCINRWKVGETYTEVINGQSETYTLNGGTMQKVLWELMEDKQHSSALDPSTLWFNHIYADCNLPERGDFVPQCNDFIPIIIVDRAGNAVQNVYAQTTLALLHIPCFNPTAGTGMGQTLCDDTPRTGAPPGPFGDRELFHSSLSCWSYC